MNNIVDVLTSFLKNEPSIQYEAAQKNLNIDDYAEEKARNLSKTPRGLAIYNIIMEQLKGVLNNV